MIQNKKYKRIHIWSFPIVETFIRLSPAYKKQFFSEITTFFGSQQKLVDYLNDFSKEKQIGRKISRLNLYSMVKSTVKNKGETKKVNVPLWIPYALFDLNCFDKNKFESEILSYSCRGKSNDIKNPKLPLELTPELFSVIFHFFADGHIGGVGVSSSYRQMNKQGLQNFLNKLRNCFGQFNYSKKEYKNGRLNIPKAITNFYNHFFHLPSTRTMEGFIPTTLKEAGKEFLLAGLISYIIDDGYIGEVITIYSKNKRLISDINDISLKCGYITYPIREKYRYGYFDVYRFSISSKSYKKLYDDISNLSKIFPTCDLAHKQRRLALKLR